MADLEMQSDGKRMVYGLFEMLLERQGGTNEEGQSQGTRGRLGQHESIDPLFALLSSVKHAQHHNALPGYAIAKTYFARSTSSTT
jgi:hypothetical protein